MQTQIEKTLWGEVAQQAIYLYTLRLDDQHAFTFSNYGAIIQSITMADKKQQTRDVVLGYKDIRSYQQDSTSYMGGVPASYANRIKNASFELDGICYQLEQNDGQHALHAGQLHQRVWDSNIIDEPHRIGVSFHTISPHLTDGLPGNVNITVNYFIEPHDSSTLHIEYRASTDQATVINLTNHAYFNLNGEGHTDINNHWVKINADTCVETNSALIPTGKTLAVHNTAFDFTCEKQIQHDIDQKHPMLLAAKGYDVNYVLPWAKQSTLCTQLIPQLAATVKSPLTGICLDVLTTHPGLQFYTGNSLQANVPGKSDNAYGKHAGFCVETQHFPDSPNHTHFPSTTLRPEQTFSQKSIFKFYLDPTQN